MTPTVHKRKANVAEIVYYCFLSTPKIVDCFNDYFNLSIPNSAIVSASKALTPFFVVFSQMPPPQGTPSLGWLTAPSRPATASGLSQSRCLCTPRSSPPSMKVRVRYCLSPSSAALFSLTHILFFFYLSAVPLNLYFNSSTTVSCLFIQIARFVLQLCLFHTDTRYFECHR